MNSNNAVLILKWALDLEGEIRFLSATNNCVFLKITKIDFFFFEIKKSY
jgi:hypothetical protein